MAEKLLIITYDMIPCTRHWGGCQRMFFLAEHLQHKGYDVSVFHSLKSNTGTFGKVIHFNGIPAGFKSGFIQSFVNSRNKTDKTNRKRNKNSLPGLLSKLAENTIRFIDSILFNEPNPGMGFISNLWIRSASGPILEYIGKNEIRTIIISGPPFGTFSIVPKIKKNYPDVKVVLDYRDPWNLWNNRKGPAYFKERKIARLADRIIVTNGPLKGSMAGKLKIEPKKIEVISNGYSEIDWETIKAKAGKNKKRMVISHIGSMNFHGYRNPSGILSALEDFPARDEILLQFIGIDQDETTKTLSKKFGGSIRFLPKVPHRESLSEMLDSDVLLLVHTTTDVSARYLVSAKLYDYIRSGRPVWSIGSSKALNSLTITELALGLVCRNRRDEISAQLKQLYDLWKQGRLGELRRPDLDVIPYSREYQNEKYAELVHHLSRLH
jgi:glycosyltransferase involved in cell wall biosynthesis